MRDSLEYGQRLACAPFPPQYRASGLLLHVTSLPSRYGIGDLGEGAYTWIDRLHEAGQTWWQALPLGPTGYENSPYQCLSSFAGNGLLISPDLLIEDGLLRPEECEASFSSIAIDYDAVIAFKHGLLPKVWARFKAGVRKDLLAEYEGFCESRAAWLEDYALFRALKAKFNGASYLEWPRNLFRRESAALWKARRELAIEIDQIRVAQFLLFRQFALLKEYAHGKSVGLIGDLPFFVAFDSSDVWAHPEFFLLDKRRRPKQVAGVPPDYFSADGQLWGNPVYNWDGLDDAGYDWWIARITTLLDVVDLIRLDHFRGFSAAWHIPAGAETARAGQWIHGPGPAFFRAVKARLGLLPFIAEDLGCITTDVVALRNQFEVPSTRVLQFAFDGDPDNSHLPDRCPANAIMYTGTHDNATAREWYGGLSRRSREYFWRCLKRPAGEVNEAAPAMLETAWSSPAALAVAPLQDVLNLGRPGRMNVPGRADGNWRWRATRHMLSPRTFEPLRVLNRRAQRRRPLTDLNTNITVQLTASSG
jgi:4-alpha-glucanotransferase